MQALHPSLLATIISKCIVLAADIHSVSSVASIYQCLSFIARSSDVQTGVFFAYVPANQNVILAKVRIFDNMLVEETEAFGVQLYIPNHHEVNGVKLGNPSHTTVFIKDGKVAVFNGFECVLIRELLQ